MKVATALACGVKMPKGSRFNCPSTSKQITLQVDGSDFIHPDCLFIVMAARAYRHGILPEAGPLFDQSYPLIEAIQFCVSEMQQHEAGE